MVDRMTKFDFDFRSHDWEHYERTGSSRTQNSGSTLSSEWGLEFLERGMERGSCRIFDGDTKFSMGRRGLFGDCTSMTMCMTSPHLRLPVWGPVRTLEQTCRLRTLEGLRGKYVFLSLPYCPSIQYLHARIFLKTKMRTISAWFNNAVQQHIHTVSLVNYL